MSGFCANRVTVTDCAAKQVRLTKAPIARIAPTAMDFCLIDTGAVYT